MKLFIVWKIRQGLYATDYQNKIGLLDDCVGVYLETVRFGGVPEIVDFKTWAYEWEVAIFGKNQIKDHGLINENNFLLNFYCLLRIIQYNCQGVSSDVCIGAE